MVVVAVVGTNGGSSRDLSRRFFVAGFSVILDGAVDLLHFTNFSQVAFATCVIYFYLYLYFLFIFFLLLEV